MQRSTRFTTFALMCLSFMFALSNTGIRGEDIFAPFISKLDARVQENSVILSWEDANVSIHHYNIYRSTEKITKNSFSKAKLLAKIEKGRESYIDHPPTTAPYYYAVLAGKDEERVYELFIPYRNVTVNSVMVATTSSPEEMATEIRSIKASVRDESVVIEFERTKPDRTVIVYRSTSPLASVDRPVDAQVLSTISSSENRIVDYPLPGISYYYGVLDAQLAKAGTYDFVEGSNATTSPVEVPLEQSRISTVERGIKRSTPLAYLHLSESVLTGRSLSKSISLLVPSKEPETLSPETIKIFDALLREVPQETRTSPSPQILPVDKTLEADGSDYRLAKIVQRGFSEKNWDSLSEEIQDFLKVDHRDNTERRARFYLGQTYYFRHQYRKAFLEFTLVREEYRNESDAWLSHIYPRLF